MTDDIEGDGGEWHPHVMLGTDGGECYFLDIGALLEDHEALAVKFEGGELYLFQKKTYKWAALSSLKPKSDQPNVSGKVSAIRR